MRGSHPAVALIRQLWRLSPPYFKLFSLPSPISLDHASNPWISGCSNILIECGSSRRFTGWSQIPRASNTRQIRSRQLYNLSPRSPPQSLMQSSSASWILCNRCCRCRLSPGCLGRRERTRYTGHRNYGCPVLG
jgi:hypothetical protein